MESIEKRFIELAERADERYYNTFSDFLNMEEQSILSSLRLETPFCLNGGYASAERRIAVFGAGCESAVLPIKIIKIEPLSKKFADKLTHRDFLGSLMALGIRREMLGDIVVDDNTAVLFCLEAVAEFIVNELSRIRRTSVKCSIVESAENLVQSKAEERELIAASERLDVIVAAVYGFSRSAVKEVFSERRIFVNSRLCENFSYMPKENDVVSVRHCGRFIYCGVLGETKKGRKIIGIMQYK